MHKGLHAASHRRRKRVRRIMLKPDGLGFLKRTVTEKRLQDVTDLSSLTRFQCMLLGGTHPGDTPVPTARGWRMTKIDKIALEVFESGNPTRVVRLPTCKAQAQSAAIVYRLALMAAVSPSSVVGALVCYGLEALAQELREHAAAPPLSPARVRAPFAQKAEPANVPTTRPQVPSPTPLTAAPARGDSLIPSAR